MLAHLLFGVCHHAGPDQFGLPLKIGQHLPRGGFVTATRGNSAYNSRPIAVLRDKKWRFNGKMLPAILTGSKLGIALPASCVLPKGVSLSFANNRFSFGRHWPCHGFFEYGSQCYLSFGLAHFQAEKCGEPVR